MAELREEVRCKTCGNSYANGCQAEKLCGSGYSEWKPKSSPVLGETVMPLVVLDDFDLRARTQRDADLAILRAERLKEAEWLEKWYNDPNTDIDDMHAHIASLKGDREGG